MTVPRSAELRWQKEILELWLNTARIPPDARTGFLEILQAVKEEIKEEIEELHFGGQRN